MNTTPRDIASNGKTSPPLRRRSNAADGQELSIRFFVSVFAQWWKLMLPISLAALAISLGIILYLFEPQYRSTAMLQVRSFQPFVVFPDGAQLADEDNARKFMMTQIEFLRSPVVIGDALAAPGIAELPELVRRRDKAEWLANKGLEIRQRGHSEILEVAFAASDPRNAQKVVNAVLEAYMNVLQDEKSGQSEDIKRILRESRDLREEEIRELQDYIRTLQADLVTNDPSPLSSIRPTDIVVSENPLKGVQENLNQAQIEEEILLAQVRAIEESTAGPGIKVADVLIDAKIDERPEVQNLIEQLNGLQAELDQMARAYPQGESDPRYQRSAAELERLQARLKSLRDASRPRIEAEMQALASFERQSQLSSLRTELATQRLVVQKMRENYQSLVGDLRRTGSQSLTLQMSQRKLEQRQHVLDQITERIEHLETETSAPDRVTVFSKPTLPAVAKEMLPWKPLLIACVASLGIPFGIGLLWERSVRRVTSVEQLKRGSVPVVGEIARLPLRTAKSTHRRNELDYELGLFEESVDSLRTGLVLSHQAKSIQVLAVSSAVPGEGKSSVASQLAVSLARATGSPTLLIDGDMRSPDLHRIFQIELGPGLADVLTGGHRISKCINREFNDQVHILPAGTLTKSPHKLLGRDRFKSVLNWARRHYDFVVVDTPPILAASEAMVMSCAADGTLLCAMRDVSREDHVKTTYNRLSAVGANPIGTVLSGVPTRQYARRYGAYIYNRHST